MNGIPNNGIGLIIALAIKGHDLVQYLDHLAGLIVKLNNVGGSGGDAVGFSIMLLALSIEIVKSSHHVRLVHYPTGIDAGTTAALPKFLGRQVIELLLGQKIIRPR